MIYFIFSTILSLFLITHCQRYVESLSSWSDGWQGAGICLYIKYYFILKQARLMLFFEFL